MPSLAAVLVRSARKFGGDTTPGLVSASYITRRDNIEDQDRNKAYQSLTSPSLPGNDVSGWLSALSNA